MVGWGGLVLGIPKMYHSLMWDFFEVKWRPYGYNFEDKWRPIRRLSVVTSNIRKLSLIFLNLASLSLIFNLYEVCKNHNYNFSNIKEYSIIAC